MKFNNYFTTALGMIGAFPGYSLELTLSKNAHNKPVPEVLTDFPGRPCRPEDHVFGCLLPPDAKPRFCEDDSKFFDAANWDESGAGQAYTKWIQTIDQSSAAWTNRTSEPTFFMERVLKWKDFDCGVGLRGCDMKPSCDDILTRLGDKDKARKVYFILKSMENLSLITSVIAEQSIPAQLGLTSMSGSIAHTFLWKYDEKIQQKCELMAGLAKAAIRTAFVILGAVAAPEAAAATAGLGTAAVQETAAITTSIARSSPWTYVQLINGVGGDALTRSVCANFPNAPENYEKEAKLAIDRFIRASGEDYRAMVEGSNSDIEHGIAFSEGAAVLLGHGTVLANVLQFGEYVQLSPEQHRRFVEQPTLIEQDIKAHFKNAVISTVLKNQMCFIQCSPSASKQPDHTRFTPEIGKYCEAKCWQNWNGEKELNLFGLEELVKDNNEWNIDLSNYLQASYDHYKAHGYRHEETFPSVEDLFKGKISSTSGSWLPVCDTHVPHDKSGMPKGMPCACGDKYGSDTAAFWKESNFDSWVADKSPGPKETNQGTIYLCRNELANVRTPPVTYFLNMCNAGWHWPYKSESSIWPTDSPHAFDWPQYSGSGDYLIKGADEKCAAFKAKVDDINSREVNGYAMTEQALNCEMCFLDDLGIYTKENQTPMIENLSKHHPYSHNGLDYNFKRACKLYREKYHCDPGLDPSKIVKSKEVLNSTDLEPSGQ
ncbi:MAG: hypothetical protein Q9188_005674 [Gyalolechia gomerana]